MRLVVCDQYSGFAFAHVFSLKRLLRFIGYVPNNIIFCDMPANFLGTGKVICCRIRELLADKQCFR